MKLYRIGEEYKSQEGDIIKIINYRGRADCDVLFIKDNIVVNNVTYEQVKKSKIKNPSIPNLFGSCFTGIGEYTAWKDNKPTIEYSYYHSMVRRCYDNNIKYRNISYEDVTVCEEWKCFQVFAKWFEENYNPETMQGWHIDKDILVKGNKIYSPNTCGFVPQEINTLILNRKRGRGNYPIGVTKSGNKYNARINKQGESNYLGTFDKPEEAFEAYKTAKEKHIKEMVQKWKDKLTYEMYQAMYNWIVEITD